MMSLRDEFCPSISSIGTNVSLALSWLLRYLQVGRKSAHESFTLLGSHCWGDGDVQGGKHVEFFQVVKLGTTCIRLTGPIKFDSDEIYEMMKHADSIPGQAVALLGSACPASQRLQQLAGIGAVPKFHKDR